MSSHESIDSAGVAAGIATPKPISAKRLVCPQIYTNIITMQISNRTLIINEAKVLENI